jgi:pSer/pThr/pTyr-binding forkhead associated (FHA) protein
MAASFTLVVAGHRVAVAPLQPCVIGRGRDVNIRIRLPIVSKRHCELRAVGDQVRGGGWGVV